MTYSIRLLLTLFIQLFVILKHVHGFSYEEDFVEESRGNVGG